MPLTNVTGRIVAIGELLWDLLPAGPRLGGTTTNFAVMSARLGADVSLVSRLGHDDFGAAARRQLEATATGTALDLSHLQQSPGLPTGTVSVQLRPDGQPTYRIDGPVAWDEITQTPELDALAAQTAVVCFGTLAQREPVSRASIRAFVQATEPGCIRVCDINLRMPFCDAETIRWCLRQATVLKVSDEEMPALAEMLGEPLAPRHGGEDARETAFVRRMLELAPSCRLVALTLGARGSLLASAAGLYRDPGIPIRVTDTIGAGDAFTTGLTYAYIRGGSLAQMSRVGNMCGSFVATQPGATPELPAALREQIAEAMAAA